MCAWGEAWAAGPTLNYGVGPDERKRLAEIAAAAEKLSVGAPEKERQLIAAMQLRYTDDAKQGNQAFADAIVKMAAANPGDDALSVVAADALMIASDYKPEKMASPVALLEGVLKRSPDYAPAIHFYIHATELAGYPKRAEPFADKLPTIAPAASHLVHMPSHTYYGVGRYADAATANVRAVELGMDNARRLKLAEPDGVWTLAYHAHNVHFGIGGALMSGDAEAGLKLARPMVAMAGRSGTLPMFRQAVLGNGFVAIARFAPPGEMLGIADPGKSNPVAQALWHYARGEAFARLDDAKAVRREAHAMAKRVEKDRSDGMIPAAFAVGRNVLEGRAAMLEGKNRRAVAFFARAAAIEEAKPLSESADPPLWWYPVRRDVAAALLAEGDVWGALAAVDASLKRRPLDPVALAIRAHVEAKLGDAAAARRDRKTAIAGWRGKRDITG
ncbi:hypothetical protein BXU08_05700 [Sphingomonas sp. LM7]|nr:hypothetical protein BXU08_05700 [Sphingomonas sp. LM7]